MAGWRLRQSLTACNTFQISWARLPDQLRFQVVPMADFGRYDPLRGGL